MSIDLFQDCKKVAYHELNLNGFDCGNDDLNEFFLNDAPNYIEQLLGKTYGFVLNEDPSQVVALFTISNDSVKTDSLPNSRKKKVNKQIPREKQFRSYPATLLGRLGVNQAFKGGGEGGVGDQMIEFLKYWFVDPENKTGCRFLVVDAYNKDNVLAFYRRNHFNDLFSSDEQEFEFLYPNREFEADVLKTRLLFFDLLDLKQ